MNAAAENAQVTYSILYSLQECNYSWISLAWVGAKFIKCTELQRKGNSIFNFLSSIDTLIILKCRKHK